MIAPILSLFLILASPLARSAPSAQSAPPAESKFPTTSGNPLNLDTVRKQAIESLNQAQIVAKQAMVKGEHWNFPLYMGANYVSQYYLMRFWLSAGPSTVARLPMGDFPTTQLKQILTTSQLPDGSWQQTPDPNLEHGNLDATIMNYWALKVMDSSQDSPTLKLARQFIQEHGGLAKSSAFTRIVLAMFSQMPWTEVPWAPLFFVNPNNPRFLNINEFPQWVRPHIVPISYLRSMHVSRNLGQRFSVRELSALATTASAALEKENLASVPAQPETNPTTPTVRQRWVINEMLRAQNTLGSWGGYTSATLFSMAAMNDYDARAGDPEEQPAILAASARGFHFVERLYLNPQNPNPLLGTVCDGRFWDTILVTQGMLSVGPINRGSVAPAIDFLIKAQRPNGGIPFGLEFETTPDIDDTSELVTTLRLEGGASAVAAADHAVEWLQSMQNSNGGWGAFDRNNTGNILLRTFSSGLKDSATMFDPSTPDVTGHTLEALGASGESIANSLVVRRAVNYLRSQAETARGIWMGRWGVNYLYGTNAVVSGLIRAGVPQTDPAILRAVQWVKSVQNHDGGFGETTKSDLDSSLAGRGISTPSQTAWALMLLIRTGYADESGTLAAVDYLNREIKNSGSWRDKTVNGTGHSGIVYLMYPSYPLAFPMIALSEFLKQTSRNP